MKKRTIAQTPSPPKDIIKGSNINKKNSATKQASSTIELSERTIKVLEEKLKAFKEKHPNNTTISLNDLKAVYRRGSGAYSTSHRPNITRAGWSYARVNKFLEKAAGNKVKEAYIQDDDLLKYKQGGKVLNQADKMGKQIVCKNCGWKWNTDNSDEHNKYICNKCNFDNRTFYDSDPVGYANGGLIAPNGKPSKLTPEQYKLVRTPAFKRWFGDWENDSKNASKVVDENGEPLVCFHGTNNEFTVFRMWYEKLIWWNEPKDFEIGSHFGTFEQAKDRGTYINPYFVNIKNLIRTTDKFNWIVASYKQIFSELNIAVPKLENYPKIINGDEYEIVLSTLKKNKIDGIIYVNKYEGNLKDDSYIVFNPNQIKVADGTNTTFDTNNPDIRYEKGGTLYPYTEKLIQELKKHSDYKKGIEGIDKETGQKYRHDRYILKYPFASYWLVKLWEKAAEENGDKNSTSFIYNKKYSFGFDRGKFKGERDGKISFTEEIELSDDKYERGGKVKTYWYTGLFKTNYFNLFIFV